jgi:hypothetical protein
MSDYFSCIVRRREKEEKQEGDIIVKEKRLERISKYYYITTPITLGNKGIQDKYRYFPYFVKSF